MGVNIVHIVSTTMIPTLNKNEYCLLVTTPGNTNDSDANRLSPGYAKYANENLVNAVNSLGIFQPLYLIQKNEYRFDCTVLVEDEKGATYHTMGDHCITN